MERRIEWPRKRPGEETREAEAKTLSSTTWLERHGRRSTTSASRVVLKHRHTRKRTRERRSTASKAMVENRGPRFEERREVLKQQILTTSYKADDEQTTTRAQTRTTRTRTMKMTKQRTEANGQKGTDSRELTEGTHFGRSYRAIQEGIRNTSRPKEGAGSKEERRSTYLCKVHKHLRGPFLQTLRESAVGRHGQSWRGSAPSRG
jgi:hypothetical protein